VLGGTYKIPVLVGQYEKTFVQDQKRDETFNEAAFGREYESRWSGTVEDAFFNMEAFEKNRILQRPEFEASGRSSAASYYILAVDVGRKGCESAVCVLKITPQPSGRSVKSLVNMYTFSGTHFGIQALKLKKLFYKYKARRLIIDANGVGLGLVDYMVMPSEDSETGETLPDFGVYNDEENYYKQYITNHCERGAMYLIKANAPINTEAHSNIQS
jgi:hypothetical protein